MRKYANGYEFDASDSDLDGVVLAFVTDSLGHDGYGEFIEPDGDVRYCHYRDAERYQFQSDAQRAVRKYKDANGRGASTCDIVQVSCVEDE